MRMKLGKGLTAVLAVSLLAAGCSTGAGDKKELKLAYVAWDSEIASTHVVKEVLESKLNYKVEMLQVDAGPMWAGVADGSADAMVAAWLPGTHASYYERYGSQVDDLGANLDGAKIGLVVPTYMDIATIADLKNADTAASLQNRIVGIEPGAGIMTATEEAIKTYGLDGITMLESSSAAMVQELQKAYDKKEPIVVTGWTPHWKFAKMELKYLEDPQGAYGGEEQIHTIVRKGLKDDHADAHRLLDQFNWTPDDMAAVMVAIQEGASPEQAAKDWVAAHAEQVNAWLEGVE